MSTELSFEYGVILETLNRLNPADTIQARGALILLEQANQKTIALKQSGINIDVLTHAYDWTIAIDGELYGLTAGDQGYEPSGIKLNETDSEAFNIGMAEHLKNGLKDGL